MINDINSCLPKQDLRSMDPWRAIVETAQASGIKIKKPKPNCKRCHGRGYVGRYAETGEPIACPCIFPKETYDREIGEVQYKPRNRAERRKQK